MTIRKEISRNVFSDPQWPIFFNQVAAEDAENVPNVSLLSATIGSSGFSGESNSTDGRSIEALSNLLRTLYDNSESPVYGWRWLLFVAHSSWMSSSRINMKKGLKHSRMLQGLSASELITNEVSIINGDRVRFAGVAHINKSNVEDALQVMSAIWSSIVFVSKNDVLYTAEQIREAYGKGIVGDDSSINIGRIAKHYCPQNVLILRYGSEDKLGQYIDLVGISNLIEQVDQIMFP